MIPRAKRALSPILGVLLVLQAGLVVSGGAVRLTGSGLGCPTWPRCTTRSYVPVPHQAQGQLHAWIEFGNRLISIALVLTALLALILVLLLKRKDIRPLALGQVLGISAQIPLGGITVLTHLNPAAVASHFLLSIILIAGATSLFSRRKENIEENSTPPTDEPHPLLQTLGLWVVSITALVIIFGTVVTGSGPNAGDASAPRFHIHIHTITRIHAAFSIVLLALTVALFLMSPSKSILRRRIAIFLALLVGQGAIGFIQFNQGFPELLVGTHLFGVTLVWISVWRIHLAVSERSMRKVLTTREAINL
ncbi:MAG: COX15/CtaA family protein [Actinomycetota bacterium]